MCVESIAVSAYCRGWLTEHRGTEDKCKERVNVYRSAMMIETAATSCIQSTEGVRRRKTRNNGKVGARQGKRSSGEETTAGRGEESVEEGRQTVRRPDRAAMMESKFPCRLDALARKECTTMPKLGTLEDT